MALFLGLGAKGLGPLVWTWVAALILGAEDFSCFELAPVVF